MDNPSGLHHIGVPQYIGYSLLCCSFEDLTRVRVSFGVSRLQSLPGGKVMRMEDKNRKKVTVAEAAEYLGLTPGKVQQMVERGVLKADKFAGAVHIPREEVERIERETAP
jgi:excisionase family DNA binding protein